jgi:hypothetical protein
MAAKKAKQPKPPAPAAMGKAAASKGQSARAQKAVSARMEKQAERGVGIKAKQSERNAIVKAADKEFGKGNYNLISGYRMKVPVGKSGFGYVGKGDLTAVAKGVGSVRKANTRITASNLPDPKIYNPLKTSVTTYVTKNRLNKKDTRKK